ncbi:MAG: amidohydrolase [Armatimonadetes bacterium]|nr:amidohydrolase [Armatimonadota bacterium]
MPEIIDINTMFGPLPIAPSDLSIEGLLNQMQRHRIILSCTISTIGLQLDHNSGNAATRAAAAESKELVPVATINPLRLMSRDEPISSLKTDGFKMVRFFPWLQGWPIQYAPFVMLGHGVAAANLPLMIETRIPGVATELLDVLGDYAGVIILTGVDSQALAESLVLMTRHANIYLETSGLISTGAIALAASQVGAERLLFGSGAPMRPAASGLNLVRAAGLAADDESAILGGNARRLLKL